MGVTKAKWSGKKEPIRLSVEQKMAAVEKFIHRGDKSAQDIADEVGTSQQMLYLWKKKVETGESLDKRSKEGRPKNKADIEKARKASSAIVIRDVPDMVVHEGSAKTTLQVKSHQSYDIHTEIVMLRAENKRLKKALASTTAALLEVAAN